MNTASPSQARADHAVTLDRTPTRHHRDRQAQPRTEKAVGKRFHGADSAPGKGGKNRTPPAWRATEPPTPRDCPKCLGSGVVETETAATDDEGEAYTEYVDSDCPTCGGKGKI